MAHGQAFRQATDARWGARRLLAISLRVTPTCALLLIRSRRARTERC